MPTTDTLAAPPVDPVSAALQDPELRERLRAQVLCRLNRWLPDQPRTRRLQEAEEVIDRVLAIAWQKRDEFEPTRDVGAWVHGIAVRVASEACRKLRKQPAQFLPDADPRSVEAEDLSEPAFDPFALLDHLPPDDRIAVEGFFRFGWSHRQIGDRLGIREGTARQRLNRALSKLRAIAGEEQR